MSKSSFFHKGSGGYTLVEILVSIALIMMMMAALSRLFGDIGREVNNTQKVMIMSGHVRNAKSMLERDLNQLYAPLTPPGKADENSGYFCYIEGDNRKTDWAYNPDMSDVDATVIDIDDILMFTVVSPPDMPFRGRFGLTNDGTPDVIESNTAEIIWFVRGNTLYRRVLLVVPNDRLQNAIDSLPTSDPIEGNISANVRAGKGFYYYFDVSAHLEKIPSDPSNSRIVANTLSDLSFRERRYGHTGRDPLDTPHSHLGNYILGMPLLQETAAITMDPYWTWDMGQPIENQFNMLANGSASNPLVLTFQGTSSPSPTQIDYWANPNCWKECDLGGSTGWTGSLGLSKTRRPGEDVVLSNVIGFDVRIWDDSVGRYVNLGDAGTLFENSDARFSPGTENSLNMIYDTFTDNYERYVVSNNTSPPYRLGRGVDQLDNNPNRNSNGYVIKESDGSVNTYSDGVIDDYDEWEFPPPYKTPLKGLQVTIRVCDGVNNKNIRQMTIVVDFSQR